MAVNDTRSMNHEMVMGSADSTYIALTPDRANVENPPYDRLQWPTYAQAERHFDPSHKEGHLVQSLKPVEHKTAHTSGDPRF